MGEAKLASPIFVLWPAPPSLGAHFCFIDTKKHDTPIACDILPITRRHEMSVEDLYAKGFEARCDGRYDDAMAAFGQILRSNPGHSDSTWQVGLIQGFQGEFELSIETLRSVVQTNPDHNRARYDLAMTLMMLGEMDEACDHFREVLRRDPNHEDAQRQAVYCP